MGLGQFSERAAKDRRGGGEQGERSPKDRRSEHRIGRRLLSLTEDEDFQLSLGEEARCEQRPNASTENYDIIVAGRQNVSLRTHFTRIDPSDASPAWPRHNGHATLGNPLQSFDERTVFLDQNASRQ